MKRLAIVAVVAGLLALACSAESTSEAHVDTGRPNPEGAIERGFVERAQRVLDRAPDPEEGWRTGVILREDDVDMRASWAMLTPDGMTLVEVAWNCHGDDDEIEEDQLWVMLDPGDLVTWNAEGDNRVCSGELTVIEKGAAS